ncbi:hypothetical protein [Thiomonas sp.]
MNWTAIESVAASLSAIVTGVMAWMTYRTIVQARIHHKDEYRPILSFAPVGVADPVHRDQILKTEMPQSPDPDYYYALHGVLSNIGRGPALNIKLTLRFLGIEGYGIQRELAPIGDGERFNFADQPLRLRAQIHRGFNDSDFQLSLNTPWEILLDYEDVFGQSFHTIHSKGWGRPWTVLGLGPASKGRDLKEVGEEVQTTVRMQVYTSDVPIVPGNP